MKRKKTTTKRRRKSVFPTRRRKRRGMSENGLSAVFNPATAQAGGRVIGAGAIGGMIAGAANRALTKTNNLTRLGIQIGASFVTYAVLKYPNMAAGMAGAFAALESKPIYDRFLAEDGDLFAQDDSINELPMVLDENGNALTLSQDESGDVVYLNEATGETMLAEDVFLQEEAFLQDDIYPSYSIEY